MQKLTGNGMAFVEVDGHCVEKELAAGESIMISTGNLAIMDDTCTMDVEDIKGVKNWLFGGEDVCIFNMCPRRTRRGVVCDAPLVYCYGPIRR